MLRLGCRSKAAAARYHHRQYEKLGLNRIERRERFPGRVADPLYNPTCLCIVSLGAKNPTLKRVFSITAFIGFCISLLVHLTTFLGINPARHIPWVWGLHVGIFVVFIPMIFAQGLTPKKDFWPKMFARTPRWARYLTKAFFAYALINFALFFVLSEGGVPQERDGKYVLHNHGNVIRELSEAEYERQNAYVLRGFSGHWMVFYLMPSLFFWYRKEETDVS